MNAYVYTTVPHPAAEMTLVATDSAIVYCGLSAAALEDPRFLAFKARPVATHPLLDSIDVCHILGCNCQFSALPLRMYEKVHLRCGSRKSAIFASKYSKSQQNLQQLTETPKPPPLAPHGTPFQQQVWQALQTVPRGKIASYTDIAVAIGKPKAVRAVAAACGANPIAVFIPCHRIVGKNGALTGYRWGIAVKERLLAEEALPVLLSTGPSRH